MSWLQLTVTVDRDRASTLTDWLDEHGALAVTVESAGNEIMFDEATPGEPAWADQKLTALFADDVEPAGLVSRVNGITNSQSSSLRRLADQDWERAWLDQFEPVRVSDRLWVCPSWIAPPDAEAVNLRIDPGLAFGTGTHPTTFLCLEYLCGCELRDQIVIDYGCGSGILGIATLALGAAMAFATDVDPRAVGATIENAHKNLVGDRLWCGLPDALPEQVAGNARGADLLIANILAGTLIRLQPTLTTLCGRGTRLLLSGILDHQADQVESSFNDRFEFERLQRGEWMLLVGTPV